MKRKLTRVKCKNCGRKLVLRGMITSNMSPSIPDNEKTSQTARTVPIVWYLWLCHLCRQIETVSRPSGNSPVMTTKPN